MDLFQTQLMTLDTGADAIAGSLDGAKVGLSVLNAPANKDRTIGEMHDTDNVPTFTGYAPQDVTWSDPTISDDGFVEFVGDVPEFRPTDAVHSDAIYLAYLEDGTGAKLYGVAKFDGAPITMGHVTDSIKLSVRWRPHDQSLVVFIS